MLDDDRRADQRQEQADNISLQREIAGVVGHGIPPRPIRRAEPHHRRLPRTRPPR